MPVANPCGGRDWLTLPSGLIEVGGDTPEYSPGSLQYEQMLQTWANFGRLLEREASRIGVPVSWLLSVATMETGRWSDDKREQATIMSPVGAIGVMQIMPRTAVGFHRDPEQMTDPNENIAVGAELIASLSNRLGPELPAISAAYNSGRVCDTSPCTKCNEWNLYADANYPGKVIRWNNAAILYGLPAPPLQAGVAFLGAGLAAAGVAVAWRMLR